MSALYPYPAVQYIPLAFTVLFRHEAVHPALSSLSGGNFRPAGSARKKLRGATAGTQRKYRPASAYGRWV